MTLIFLYKLINYGVTCSLYGVTCSDTVKWVAFPSLHSQKQLAQWAVDVTAHACCLSSWLRCSFLAADVRRMVDSTGVSHHSELQIMAVIYWGWLSSLDWANSSESVAHYHDCWNQSPHFALPVWLPYYLDWTSESTLKGKMSKRLSPLRSKGHYHQLLNKIHSPIFMSACNCFRRMENYYCH